MIDTPAAADAKPPLASLERLSMPLPSTTRRGDMLWYDQDQGVVQVLDRGRPPHAVNLLLEVHDLLVLDRLLTRCLTYARTDPREPGCPCATPMQPARERELAGEDWHT